MRQQQCYVLLFSFLLFSLVLFECTDFNISGGDGVGEGSRTDMRPTVADRHRRACVKEVSD